MKALFFYLLSYIFNHLKSIQLYIKFHFRHFYLIIHLRFLHRLSFFEHMSNKIMAFSIIPMFLIFSKSIIINILVRLVIVISMEFLLFRNS